MAYILHAVILSAIAIAHHQIEAAVNPNIGFEIGINYGLLGNDLPPATAVVDLYQKYGVTKMRIFDPNHATLEAIRLKNIYLTLGIRNEDLPNLAANQEATNSWFATNVQPYLDDIYLQTITVGNEIVPGEFAPYIVPVMQNLQNILDSKKLYGVKVSTVLASSTLGTSFPPSQGAFSPEASSIMSGVLNFLSKTKSPLLINVYPYFAVAADPVNIRLDYALFTATDVVVRDGNLSYYNMFDAVVDAFYSAMEKLGFNDIQVIVSESGWPSDGNGNLTTPQLAQTYNSNFVRHIRKNGTPKRPNSPISGFIFALFNENQKPAGVEQHFGLFYPNMTPVYPL